LNQQKDKLRFSRFCIPLVLAILAVLLTGCRTPSPGAIPTTLQASTSSKVIESNLTEAAVYEIPIAGPLSRDNAEISGLAWYHDTLILLPQYPSRFDNHLFALAKSDILAFLMHEKEPPLEPAAIPLEAPGLEEIPGYEGLEAIAFLDDQVFVLVETRAGSPMLGYLIPGEISADLSMIRLETDKRVEIQPQAKLDNLSDESLLIHEGLLYTLYEANGTNVNPTPFAHRFNLDLASEGTISFPNIEYRITDASEVDENGDFWAINYFYPGDAGKLKPAADPLTDQFGTGATHVSSEVVERLVEFHIGKQAITFTNSPPILIELMGDGTARNWEGLVRFKEMNGFLLATDKFPRTILAFIQVP
jgi:hypothetical protein